MADTLAAGFNVFTGTWFAGSAPAQVELTVIDWLRQICGLPEGAGGLLVSGGSMANLTGLAVARHVKLGDNLDGAVAYISDQCHSSVARALRVLGLSSDRVRLVQATDEYRMSVDALRAQIAADRSAGLRPFCVVANAGSTNTGAVDRLREIADLCRAEDMWLHVDGAYGGMLAIVPEYRSVLAGTDQADSLVVNPHKWLFTPFDCSAFFVKRPDVLKRAFSLVPEYLVTREQDEVVNYMDYGVQLGRRFRALKLWMVIRAFGVDGLIERLREHCALARELASSIEASDDWELMAPVPFSLVCFRFAPRGTSEAERDRLNESIMHAVNATGDAFLSHTKVHDRFTLRVAIGNLRTDERHVALVWDRLHSCAASLSV